MRKILVAVVGVLALSVPASASANFFQTKSDAVRLVRKDVGERYGEYGTSVHCSPPGYSYNPGYTYHIYECYWSNAACAGGAITITGRKDFSNKWNSYNTSVLEEAACDE